MVSQPARYPSISRLRVAVGVNLSDGDAVTISRNARADEKIKMQPRISERFHPRGLSRLSTPCYLWRKALKKT